MVSRGETRRDEAEQGGGGEGVRQKAPQKTNTMHACATLVGAGIGGCLRVWGLLLGWLRLGGFSRYNQTLPLPLLPSSLLSYHIT